MENSSAYQMGQLIGGIMVLAILIGGGVFFIVSLIKAFTTRRAGWIVAACISGLPVVLFLGLIVVGMVVGFSKGWARSREMLAADRGQSSQFMTAPMTSVKGDAIAYEISLPSLDTWTRDVAHRQFDCFFNYNDAYVGVIAEGIGLRTPQRICEISQTNLASAASQYTTTTPAPIQIDSRSWLTYDATATVKGVQVKYRYYVYSDADYTFQIITWTGPVLFDHYAPVFDRIAKSFKMPK